MKSLLIILALAVASPVFTVGATLISSFDNDLDGWVVLVNGKPPAGAAYVSLGGNPGGYMQATDITGGAYLFSAPTQFLGDLSVYNGGIISLDAKVFFLDGFPILEQGGTVTITGPNGSASLDLAPKGLSENWAIYSATMSASAWGVSESSWLSLLEDVSIITIVMDSTNGDDTTGLDNFSILLPTTPLPVLNTFDDNLEGWTVLENGPQPGGGQHVSTGGNPDGFMQAMDVTGGAYTFAAPPNALGNLSPFRGGIISFDAKIFDLDDFPILAQGGTVEIFGAGLTAVNDLAEEGFSEEWATYSATLSAQDWSVSESNWSSILADVTSITIIMDSTNGNDTTGFDNFSLYFQDFDSDGVADNTDNCIEVSNADQRDSNNDGIGNLCDFDWNNDCLVNFGDLAMFPIAFNSSVGNPNYNPDLDITGNGAINFQDFAGFPAYFNGLPGPSAMGCN